MSASAPAPEATAVTFLSVRSTSDAIALPFEPAANVRAVVLRIRAKLMTPVWPNPRMAGPALPPEELDGLLETDAQF